jgi:hypothetical protein
METLGQLSFIQFLLLVMFLYTLGPALFLYVCIRVLRDLRRIADSIEAMQVQQSFSQPPVITDRARALIDAAYGSDEARRPAPAEPAPARPALRPGISLSQFGR